MENIKMIKKSVSNMDMFVLIMIYEVTFKKLISSVIIHYIVHNNIICMMIILYIL